MDRKALLAVGKFWAVMLSLILFAFGLTALAIYYPIVAAIMLVGGMVIFFSVAIYQDEKETK